MKKPAPPKEAKADLIEEVAGLIQSRYPVSPDAAILYLLNMFTSFDLVQIRDELKERERNGNRK